MPTTQIRRIAVTIAAAAAIAATGTGITYAATSTATVYACTNSHSTLRLLSAQGKCAHGYHKAAIGQRGATGAKGATGAQGATGPEGATGASGPGAIAISATEEPSSVTRSIPGMAIEIEASCFSDSATVSIFDQTGGVAGALTVNGVTEQSADGHVVLSQKGMTQIVPINTATISYRQTTISSGFQLTAGQFDAELLVVRGDRGVSVDIGLRHTKDDCAARVQAIPAS